MSGEEVKSIRRDALDAVARLAGGHRQDFKLVLIIDNSQEES
jgi:hypothetical protein